jgi:integrase/recombinase XerD
MINSLENRVFDTRVDTHKLYVSVKTKFILRDYNKEHLPLYLHITGEGKRERLLLDIEIEKKLWCKHTERINQSLSRNAFEKKKYSDTNLIIENIEAKITNIKTVYRLSDLVLTPAKLKKELVEDLPRVNLCSFFQHAINEQKTLLAPGTYKRFQSVLNKLKTYNDNIIFTDLTLNWFESYRNYLSKIGNQKTTINSNIKVIKKILRKALKVGVKIPCDLDEIIGGSTAGNKTALEPLELTKINNYYKSEFINKHHKLILGYFLFSCVTGLRFSDVMALNREKVLGDFIQFKAEKVNKLQTISLNNTAKKIIRSNEFLFIDKLTNQYVNRELKKIMISLSIRKKIGFHCSRHTFATSFLRANGKVEDLQVLLGHSTINQSMVYVHIVAAEANKKIFLLDTLF